MRVLVGLVAMSLLLPSCAVFKPKAARSALKIRQEVEHSPVFAKSFTGFTLLDPVTGKTLVDVYGDHYFTPASMTKILTLATCLKVLGDSVPGLQYFIQDTFLVFQGTADPTFLHPKFKDSQPVEFFLRSSNLQLQYEERFFGDDRFGPGWAWEDYNEAFQPEKSAFPIHGNTVDIVATKAGIISADPEIFRPQMGYPEYNHPVKTITRNELGNTFYVPSFTTDTLSARVPFKPPYLAYWLSDLLKKKSVDPGYHQLVNGPHPPWRTLYSTPIDTVLRRMMYQSDNFIAEQMLLVCAGVKFDLLQQDTILQWALDSILPTLPQRPKWVDGSGLSRYNLMTPQSLVQVLLYLWKSQPKTRLFSLFPAGGIHGTLQDWYKGMDGKPYVFAKSGSMGGVQCLSGYIVCQSGKTLLFTFMNNNFVGSGRPWKEEMQRILALVASKY